MHPCAAWRRAQRRAQEQEKRELDARQAALAERRQELDALERRLQAEEAAIAAAAQQRARATHSNAGAHSALLRFLPIIALACL